MMPDRKQPKAATTEQEKHEAAREYLAALRAIDDADGMMRATLSRLRRKGHDIREITVMIERGRRS